MTWRRKCPECKRASGRRAPDQCEVCWTDAMERRIELQDIENDRRIDERRGK